MSLPDQIVQGLFNASGAALLRGAIVRVTSGVKQATLAQAETSLTGTIGVANNATGVGGIFNVVMAGAAKVLLVTGLAPAAGQIVYVSTTAGRGSTAQSNKVIGTIIDASAYSTVNPYVTVLLGVADVSTSTATIWGYSTIRYFAVDYAAGNDANLGYSDVDMPTAGTVALKTLTALAARLPLLGAGRKVVIAIATRAGGATYLKPDGVTLDDLLLQGIYGYRKMLIRGTVTDATAGSVKFANDSADKIMAGFVRATGTNSAGYNVTVNTSARQVTVQLAGGGAVALATNYTFRAFRIRFDSNTTTAALRNVTRMLSLVSGAGDVFHLDENLPASPVTGSAGDVFYIEGAGVAVNAWKTTISNSVTTTNTIAGTTRRAATSIVGIKQVQAGVPTSFGALAVRGVGDMLEICGCWSFADVAIFGDQDELACTSFYSDENEAVVRVGSGLKSTATIAVSFGDQFAGAVIENLNLESSAFPAAFGCQISDAHFVNLRMGCSFNALLVDSCGWGTTESSVGSHIGTTSTDTTRKPPLVDGNDGSSKAFSIADSQVRVQAIECIGAGAIAAIRLSGTGVQVEIVGAFGSSGNTSFGISLADSFDGTLIIDTTLTTVTGAAGDISLFGALTRTYAELATSGDFKDGRANLVMAISTGSLSRKITAGTIGNYPVIAVDPAAPVDGDCWLKDVGGVRTFNAQIAGTTRFVVLT